jgi:hypothetical protein
MKIMKRLNHVLSEETVTIKLCEQSILEAAKGKTNRNSVRDILLNLSYYSNKLRNMILNNTYIPSKYKECHIIDRGSKKHRVLQKPKFYPDQCMHHVMINLIKDKIIKKLDPYCIAGIKHRGIIYGHKAIKRWISNDNKGTKYCIKGDIRKFYDTIKPEIIMKELYKYIKDKRYLELIKKIVYSHKSLPLGNYTSTWFANIILTVLDRKIRLFSCVSHYLRYVDDFIILGSNKRKLQKLIPIIMDILEEIGLSLKPNYQLFPVKTRGIDIIGFRYFKGFTILRKRNLLSLTRSIRKYIKHETNKNKFKLLTRFGQLKYFNSFNLKNKIRILLINTKLTI